MRKLVSADPGRDVDIHMLPILSERTTLPALRLDALDPSFGGLGYRLALGDSGVDAVTHVLPDLIVASIGVLLTLECLDVAVAILVEVVDNPSLFGFAFRCNPLALAYRHVTLPRFPCR